MSIVWYGYLYIVLGERGHYQRITVQDTIQGKTGPVRSVRKAQVGIVVIMVNTNVECCGGHWHRFGWVRVNCVMDNDTSVVLCRGHG